MVDFASIKAGASSFCGAVAEKTGNAYHGGVAVLGRAWVWIKNDPWGVAAKVADKARSTFAVVQKYPLEIGVVLAVVLGGAYLIKRLTEARA